MKQIFVLAVMVALLACGQGGYKKPESAQDAGREFIRATLDGDLDRAKFYLLKDSANLYLFDKWQTTVFQKLSAEEKREYREATIRPVELQEEGDSVLHYIYSNSYKPKDTTVISVVKVNGEWLVDMKSLHSY